MRLLIAFAAFVALPTVLGAQRLADLQQGVRIRVESSGKRYDGRFTGIDSDSLRIKGASANAMAFDLKTTQSVQVLTGRSRGRGLLKYGGMGALGGIVAGAIVGTVTYSPCKSTGLFSCFLAPSSRADAAAMGGLVFGALGLAGGALTGLIVGSPNWSAVSP